MNRRGFLVASASAGGALAASGVATGQADGEEVVVELVDYAFEPGTDAPLRIEPGTTVRFVWVTDTHNIVVEDQPAGADWAGHEEIQNGGYEYTFTFEAEGTYEIFCQPHEQLGMVGTIEVGDTDGDGAAIPPAEQEIDPHQIGVPIQKHFIGIGTFFAIFLTLVFTFYVLKYGESPRSGSPNRK